MKLKKISIENIRSYKAQEIEFPEGATLLSGDIGAGKTTILLAIEFALFGLQPGQRGTSLLKNGKDNAKVLLEFEVDGNQIIIERSLKRGKSISQDSAAITINGEKQELAVTELKSRVLDLLDYPKEFAKKQNLLYKFTVYTPQEEMKQIILQDSETRINTLRHVFGIDKYKKILENISVVTSKIREEKRLKEGITLNIEQDKLLVVSKEEELEEKQYNLKSTEKELFESTEKRKKIQEEKQEINEKIEEKNKLEKEIDKTKLMISNKNELLFGNKKKIEQINLQINELNEIKFDEKDIATIQEYINELKKEKEKLDSENLTISSEITSLNYKNKENDSIKEKLKVIEVCPTCLQDVNESYKNNVINKMDSNISTNTSKINKLNKRKQEILDRNQEISREILMKEEQVQDLNILKIKLQGIKEKQESILEIEQSNNQLNQDIDFLNSHLNTLKNNVLELNKYQSIFEEKQMQLEQALNNEKQIEIRVAELRKEIYMIEKSIQELQEKIAKAEEVRQQAAYLSELENWLTKKFIPLVSHTEKNVMIKLKAEFSKLFKQWFSMLVSDNFEVRLDDDFTPIIEQQDYEIDYVYLSGGERTAIALAYRLALNQVINSLLSKIKTKDLVILDEPTDGFSEAQLDKMRDVLQELNVSQLIIVSHERKIEDFVENVIKLKKDKGISNAEIIKD